MGNVYYEQGKYPSAIKQYRMALDALPPSAAAQCSRLMNNIGLAFVQLGQYADAAGTFETALDMSPDHQVCAGSWRVFLGLWGRAVLLVQCVSLRSADCKARHNHGPGDCWVGSCWWGHTQLFGGKG